MRTDTFVFSFPATHIKPLLDKMVPVQAAHCLMLARNSVLKDLPRPSRLETVGLGHTSQGLRRHSSHSDALRVLKTFITDPLPRTAASNPSASQCCLMIDYSFFPVCTAVWVKPFQCRIVPPCYYETSCNLFILCFHFLANTLLS